MPIVLGIDHGLATLGLAVVELTASGEVVRSLEVVRTDKSDRKREVRASDDNVRRLVELSAALEARIGPEVVALAAESQSWPRSALSIAKVAMVWGVIGAVAQRHSLPVIQASPQEAKRALTGRKDASKGDVQVALEVRYPDLPDWPRPRALVEHAADALAAVVACLDHSVVKLARRLAPPDLPAVELARQSARGAVGLP